MRAEARLCLSARRVYMEVHYCPPGPSRRDRPTATCGVGVGSNHSLQFESKPPSQQADRLACVLQPLDELGALGEAQEVPNLRWIARVSAGRAIVHVLHVRHDQDDCAIEKENVRDVRVETEDGRVLGAKPAAHARKLWLRRGHWRRRAWLALGGEELPSVRRSFRCAASAVCGVQRRLEVS